MIIILVSGVRLPIVTVLLWLFASLSQQFFKFFVVIELLGVRVLRLNSLPLLCMGQRGNSSIISVCVCVCVDGGEYTSVCVCV